MFSQVLLDTYQASKEFTGAHCEDNKVQSSEIISPKCQPALQINLTKLCYN